MSSQSMVSIVCSNVWYKQNPRTHLYTETHTQRIEHTYLVNGGTATNGPKLSGFRD